MTLMRRRLSRVSMCAIARNADAAEWLRSCQLSLDPLRQMTTWECNRVVPRQREAFRSCRLRHCWVASAGAKPLERTFSDSGAGSLHVA
ncbi:hypothetical protein R20943_07187 [Paraburkholderia aspalathi]|nr:hypothetical protein R20943_07187 [Paraburkholderia aspalathi]